MSDEQDVEIRMSSRDLDQNQDGVCHRAIIGDPLLSPTLFRLSLAVCFSPCVRAWRVCCVCAYCVDAACVRGVGGGSCGVCVRARALCVPRDARAACARAPARRAPARACMTRVKCRVAEELLRGKLLPFRNSFSYFQISRAARRSGPGGPGPGHGNFHIASFFRSSSAIMQSSPPADAVFMQITFCRLCSEDVEDDADLEVRICSTVNDLEDDRETLVRKSTPFCASCRLDRAWCKVMMGMSLSEQMVMAAYEGDAKRVEKLLNKGAPV